MYKVLEKGNTFAVTISRSVVAWRGGGWVGRRKDGLQKDTRKLLEVMKHYLHVGMISQVDICQNRSNFIPDYVHLITSMIPQ